MEEKALMRPAALDVVARLEKTVGSFRIERYTYHAGGGTRDAARQLDVGEYQIIKTLIFIPPVGADTRPVAALMHGTHRVSLRKLERLTGTRRLLPASPEETTALTGLLPGAVSPFCLPEAFHICIQETIRDIANIYCNAGERGIVIGAPVSCLDTLPAQWGDIMANSP